MDQMDGWQEYVPSDIMHEWMNLIDVCSAARWMDRWI